MHAWPRCCNGPRLAGSPPLLDLLAPQAGSPPHRARATAAAAAGFVLYGGTAIALRCGHRVSVDFDFFTARPLERAALQRLLPWLESSTVLQDQPGTFTVLSAGDALRLRFPGERRARCAGGFSPLATSVSSPRPPSSLDLSPSEPLR